MAAAVGGLLARVGMGLLSAMGGDILSKGIGWVGKKITTAIPFLKTIFGGSDQASSGGQPVKAYTENGGMNPYEDSFRRAMMPIGKFIDQKLPQGLPFIKSTE